MIVTSPYRRARETAVIAAKALAYKDELIAANSLVPHAHVHEFWEEIRMHRAEPQLLLVSHEPLLSAAAAFLIGAPNARIDFKKGAMMRLDVDGFSAQPVATLKWYLTARLVT
jgi:phosphohistidine phosphatase